MSTICKPIELTVPAEQDMMIVIRLTTAGVLARSGLSVDAVDDLKMAAEEACHCLMRCSGCRTLHLIYRTETDGFHLRAEVEGSFCGCSKLSDEEIDVIRCVLASMTDEVELTFDARMLIAIDMRKRLPA